MTKTDAQYHEDRVIKQMGKCHHFTGTVNMVCKAGVRYIDVELNHEPIEYTRRGATYHTKRSLPCIQELNRGGASCAQCNTPDRAEAEQAIEQQDREIAEWSQKITDNICPTHNIRITKQQVGQCVYAKECGCRLYQGSIK